MNSGTVESCLTWPLFGHLLGSPVEYLLNSVVWQVEPKAGLFGAFYNDCQYWARIAKQMCADEMVL